MEANFLPNKYEETKKEVITDYPKHIVQKGETDKAIIKAVQEQLRKRGITNVAIASGGFGARQCMCKLNSAA